MLVNDLLNQLHLAGGPKKVLIIEDQVVWLRCLSAKLAHLGHHVTSVVGVLEISEQSLVGLDVEIVGATLQLNPREFDCVFLDYHFAGQMYNGATFLAEFRRISSAAVFGMSSDRGLNAQILALGASGAMAKHQLKQVFSQLDE